MTSASWPESTVGSDLYYRLGLLGHPLGHTLSPVLHQWMLSHTGLKGFYVPLDHPEVRTAMKAAHALRFAGLNVTVPHKLGALKAAHEATETARLIGAANTLLWRPEGWTAHNTDGEGLLLSLRESFGRRGPRAAVIIGAGGAARGVLWALAAWGVKDVQVLNRTLKTAKALSPLAKALGIGFSAGSLEARTVIEAPLVVQSTSVGMSPHIKAFPTTPVLPKNAKVIDLIYRPRKTAFLTACQAQGAQTTDGLAMLAYQAKLAFELWTNRKAPSAAYREFVNGLVI